VAKVTIADIVSEDKHDVGFLLLRDRWRIRYIVAATNAAN
jgi:hypothetical protein